MGVRSSRACLKQQFELWIRILKGRIFEDVPHPCDTCAFPTPEGEEIGRECAVAILNQCTFQFENDKKACLDILPGFLLGGAQGVGFGYEDMTVYKIGYEKRIRILSRCL